MNNETCNSDDHRRSAGHGCRCIMAAGHGGRHGCNCGATWKTEEKEEA